MFFVAHLCVGLFIMCNLSPRSKKLSCNQHVVKAVNEYIKNNSRSITFKEENSLVDFILRQRKAVENSYEYESVYVVNQKITVNKVGSKRINRPHEINLIPLDKSSLETRVSKKYVSKKSKKKPDTVMLVKVVDTKTKADTRAADTRAANTRVKEACARAQLLSAIKKKHRGTKTG